MQRGGEGGHWIKHAAIQFNQPSELTAKLRLDQYHGMPGMLRPMRSETSNRTLSQTVYCTSILFLFQVRIPLEVLPVNRCQI